MSFQNIPKQWKEQNISFQNIPKQWKEQNSIPKHS